MLPLTMQVDHQKQANLDTHFLGEHEKYHWGSLGIWKAKICSNLLYPGPFLFPSKILALTLYYSYSISHLKWTSITTPSLETWDDEDKK